RRDGPTCLVLTRQNLPHIPRSAEQQAAVARGGYVLAGGEQAPRVVLLATGSEVALAVAAARELTAGGIAARVVSMPSTDRFDAEPASYREQVLPPGVPVVVIEAGATHGWWRY